MTTDDALRTIREDLGATLFVEASAGTGKTTALVDRIIAVVRAGIAGLSRVVAVTFTDKAAGEMKLRLRSGLDRAREQATAAARPHLDQALAELEVARIGTIHGLSADLLREFPVEARVDPLFEVLAEGEAEALFERGFEAWFHEALHDPPEGVRRALRRGVGGKRPREALRDGAYRLAQHRDFPHPWRRGAFAREAVLDEAVAPLLELAEVAVAADDAGDTYLADSLAQVRRFASDLVRRERQTGVRDHDGLEAELAKLARDRAWSRNLGTGAGKLRVRARGLRDVARAAIESTRGLVEADLAACLQQELAPVIEAYDREKARTGKLDFLDLLLRARNLLREEGAVRRELQARFRCIFVDELQDTDPLQLEILLLLAADDPEETSYARATPAPGKLFLVGDPKQSIYRFRRADVDLYAATKARLVESGARVAYLSTSYRSAPAIQAAVNLAFGPAMTRPGAPSSRVLADQPPAGARCSYVPLMPSRPAIPDQPAVVALPVPRPYGEWGKITSRAVRESLPDAVGAFVEWLVRHSGWKVTERDAPDELVPVGARHVCLLFKRFQSFGEDITRGYVRALEARHVPHVLVGGRSFFEREEVVAVRSALTAIEWPDDDLAVYATLRGPFFAFGDDALLAYRAARRPPGAPLDRLGSLDPMRPLRVTTEEEEEAGLASVSQALALLGSLHVARNSRPIAGTLEELLHATRAHAGIAIWPTGEQALANVLRVLDMARAFEGRRGGSFRGFVEKLEADAESGSAAEAPVVEEGTDGVRIMTVHRAKGLEFPVVILADPTAPSTQREPTHHVDPERGLWAEAIAGCMPADLLDRRAEVLARDEEENVRLAYVAATRARDLLVVPVTGDGPIEGWLSTLSPVLYPEPSRRREAQVAPGCPSFGPDSVLERPARANRDEEGSVMPGRHMITVGGASAEVVWWDPAALALDRDVEGGLRQQRLLAADKATDTIDEATLAHEAWSENRAEILARGSKKSLVVRSVVEVSKERRERPPEAWVARERDDEAPAPLVELADSGVDRTARPTGLRFGTLVHALLAIVPFDADAATILSLATAEGRQRGASNDEVQAAAEAARAALAHPLLRAAAEANRRGECRRERPIALPRRGGEILDGTIDLAFREAGEWRIVDFKTDHELASKKARYETQVLLYVEAVREATGEPARGVILAV